MDEHQVSRSMVLILLVMGAFGVMGGGLVAPGLPVIGAAFQAPEEQVGLILSMYTLGAALGLPVIGYLIDSVGRRKVGITCLFIDGIAGLAIIFAPNFSFLLLLRFIQGIGLAGLVPVAMTVIGDLFSGDRRLQLMGYLSGTISLGAVVIPLIGGMLASIHWQSVFTVYGFSLLLGIIFYFTLPETAPRTETRESETQTALQYGFSLFSTLKIKKIQNVIMHSLILYFLLYALVTYLPVYLIEIHGFNEIFSGIALSAQATFSVLLASKATVIADHLNWRKRTALGFAPMAISFLTFPHWPKGSYLVSFSVIMYGIGMGIVSPTIYNRITRLSPPELSGSVIALFNTMKYVGMTIAPLIIGLSLLFTPLNIIFISIGIFTALWATIALLQGLRQK